PPFGVGSAREDAGFVAGGREVEERLRTLLEVERTGCSLVGDLQLARVPGPEAQRIRAAMGEEPVPAPADPRLAASVAETRLDRPAHSHRARKAVDDAYELAEWSQRLCVAEQQRVGHAHRTRRSAECRLEHVRAALVAALRFERF